MDMVIHLYIVFLQATIIARCDLQLV